MAEAASPAAYTPRQKIPVALADIKVPEAFRKRPPRPERLEECRRYYERKGRTENHMVVDRNLNLIDGYANYLVALENGAESAICYVDDGRRVDLILGELAGKPVRLAYTRSLRRELDDEPLAPGDAVAGLFGGRLLRVIVTGTGTAPRIETLDMDRAIGRWRSKLPERQAEIGKEHEP